jgi:hypothetical protein
VGKKRQQMIQLKFIQTSKPINQVANSASLSLILKNFLPLNSIPKSNQIISIVSTPQFQVSTRNPNTHPKKDPKLKNNQKQVRKIKRIIKKSKDKRIIITTIFNHL